MRKSTEFLNEMTNKDLAKYQRDEIEICKIYVYLYNYMCIHIYMYIYIYIVSDVR